MYFADGRFVPEVEYIKNTVQYTYDNRPEAAKF